MPLHPLIISFSDAQLNQPAQDKVNAIESVLLHLRREDVQALSGESPTGQVPLYTKVKPFLSTNFYETADPKRAARIRGADRFDVGENGLLEVSYVVYGALFAAKLTDAQQAFVEDSGFKTNPYTVSNPDLCHLCAF